jgi:hypothetical protein
MAGVSAWNGHVRTVSPQECRLVGRRWLTLAEAPPEIEEASSPAAGGDADETLDIPL